MLKGNSGVHMRIRITAVVSFLVIVLICGCSSTEPQAPQSEVKPLTEVKKGSDEDMISRWKIQIVTIADVEAGRTKFDKPSGRGWGKFKAGIRSEDELWYFCSPGKTWEDMMGWRGYAIFRKGRLISHYTTAEN
jgi:uncharacterized protein YceK